MNTHPTMLTQAALRFRADQIFEETAGVRRRSARRRAQRLQDEIALRRTIA
ncbi:hypothetical protein [Nocardioides sp.]|uniref:hypothetical protein n=1 Tax=Nocardioides sp. TaxID=35761 RepID=UPI0035295556